MREICNSKDGDDRNDAGWYSSAWIWFVWLGGVGGMGGEDKDVFGYCLDGELVIRI